jgi:hypothetical protein
MFHHLSLLWAALLVLVPSLVTGQWTKSSCQFSVSGGQDSPTIVGPKEIVDRIIFLKQPDSPLQIVSADFSDATLVVDGERSYFEYRHTIEVRNRSNRVVLGFRVAVQLHSRTGASGGDAVWKGKLQPGGVVEVDDHPGKGYSEGRAPGGDVVILLWVESVRFNDCVYSPSKGVRSLWGDPS